MNILFQFRNEEMVDSSDKESKKAKASEKQSREEELSEGSGGQEDMTYMILSPILKFSMS